MKFFVKKLLFLFVLSFVLFPVNSQIQNNIKQDALVLYNNGKYKESIAVCEQELQSNPNRIESIYNWSREYWLPVEKLTKY